MKFLQLAGVALAASFVACGAARVDPGGLETVAMNKVYPYPNAEEQAKSSYDVAIAVSQADDVEAGDVAPARDQIRDYLAGVMDKAGARVVESGADRRLTASIADYDYRAPWEKPTNWTFKSDAEMAQVPGTCTHRAEVDLEVDIHEGGHRLRSFLLHHASESETETLDRSCPFEEHLRQQLVQLAVEEALPCLRIPLMNSFASRGYLMERRGAPTESDQLFRTTLPVDALEVGEIEVQVFRAQYSTGSNGERVRNELLIASGTVTEITRDGYAWISVDVSDATQPLLQGDVVRPIYREDTIDGVNPWSTCAGLLSEQ